MGPSELQKPLCAPCFLFVEKGFSFLGLLWVPKGRLKQVTNSGSEGMEKQGKSSQARGALSFNNSPAQNKSPSSSSRDIHNNLRVSLIWSSPLTTRPQTGWNQEADGYDSWNTAVTANQSEESPQAATLTPSVPFQNPPPESLWRGQWGLLSMSYPFSLLGASSKRFTFCHHYLVSVTGFAEQRGNRAKFTWWCFFTT